MAAVSRTHLNLSQLQTLIDAILTRQPTYPITIPSRLPIHPGRLHSASLLGPVTSFNSIYLLTFQSLSLILKIAPRNTSRVLRYESSAVPLLAMEVHVLTLLENHNTSHPTEEVPVPKLVAYDSTGRLLPSPWLLMTYLPGINLSSCTSLDATTRSQILEKAGSYLRVINDLSPPTAQQRWRYWGSATGTPYKSAQQWVEAHLEALLRDGEDMRLLLPYEQIRKIAAVWGHFLDAPVGSMETDQLSDTDKEEGRISGGNSQEEGPEEDLLANPPHVPSLCILDCSLDNILVSREAPHTITGMLDFERVVWGDPLLQPLLRHPEACLGWLKTTTSMNQNTGRRARELIYTILEATTAILNTFFRQQQSHESEMIYRKSLAEALEELRGMQLGGG